MWFMSVSERQWVLLYRRRSGWPCRSGGDRGGHTSAHSTNSTCMYTLNTVGNDIRGYMCKCRGDQILGAVLYQTKVGHCVKDLSIEVYK